MGHTRLFSPWKHLVDPASRRLLEAQGWELPDPERAPTGAELVEQYVAPLAAARARSHPACAPGSRSIGVTREGMDRTRTRGRFATPFAVRIRTADGAIEDVAARAVIDASGTYRSPNSLSSSGLDLLGMTEIADRVTARCPTCSAATAPGSPAGTPRSSAPGTPPRTRCSASSSSPARSRGRRVTWLIRNAQRGARVVVRR